MGNDRDAAVLVDPCDRLVVGASSRRHAFDADREQVAVRGRHLDAGDADQPVLVGNLRRALRLADHVVVGYHHCIESDLRSVFQDEFHRLVAVVAVVRVDVRVDADSDAGHTRIRRWEVYKCAMDDQGVFGSVSFG